MLVPVRCFSCGKVLAGLMEQFVEQVSELEDNPPKPATEPTGERIGIRNESTILDDLGVRRYCCRRMIISNVGLIEKLLNYNPEERRESIAAQKELKEKNGEEQKGQPAWNGST